MFVRMYMYIRSANKISAHGIIGVASHGKRIYFQATEYVTKLMNKIFRYENLGPTIAP